MGIKQVSLCKALRTVSVISYYGNVCSFVCLFFFLPLRSRVKPVEYSQMYSYSYNQYYQQYQNYYAQWGYDQNTGSYSYSYPQYGYTQSTMQVTMIWPVWPRIL